MPHPLYVAFIWHQHQPIYKSRQLSSNLEGQYRLPWVRLHGTKDYLDLALILEQYPKLHQTINLVPSLILQLEEYAAGVALDPHLILTLTPEAQLTPAQQQQIAERFFDANHRTAVFPHPRYAQLYEQRTEKGLAWCLRNWTQQDYSDLLAWYNLAWIDPLFWDDPEVAAWLAQGRDFTLSDRQRIVSKQREIISRILPQHRQLQDAGQLEITTSPYTHPILPLLADTEAAQVAIAGLPLPRRRFQYPEDIDRHLRKARDIYRHYFGREVRGLWPSEQSVSPAVLPPIAAAGFNWLCSDEAVLGWSLKHYFHRDEIGNVTEPQLLYRPYRLETPAGDLAMTFRDHRLSDLIGFTYAAMDARHAAADLIGHLDAIARSLKELQGDGTALEAPWLVTIALDGENCWEHYEQDGLPFLRALYERLSLDKDIELVTVSEFLERFPPAEVIPAQQLHSGSWIDGSFTTWIGDSAKNRAWDLLTEAREVLAKHPEATEENNPEVWESLYAAEGSDWFWWFGEGHSSDQDAIFDQLFREHLRAIYHSLNEPVPPQLFQPLEDHAQKLERRPESFIHPAIDGKGDEQDWQQAGRLEVGGARGTMHRSSTVQRLFYGVNHLNFFLRLDFKLGFQLGKDLPPELHLLWYYAGIPRYNSPAPLSGLPDKAPLNYRFHHHLGVNLLTESVWLQEAEPGEHHGWHPRASRAEVALGQSLELAVPWTDLRLEPDYSLHLIAVLADRGEFRAYVPEDGLLMLQVP